MSAIQNVFLFVQLAVPVGGRAVEYRLCVSCAEQAAERLKSKATSREDVFTARLTFSWLLAELRSHI